MARTSEANSIGSGIARTPNAGSFTISPSIEYLFSGEVEPPSDAP